MLRRSDGFSNSLTLVFVENIHVDIINFLVSKSTQQWKKNYDLIKCILASRSLSFGFLCEKENENMTWDILLSFSTYRSNGIFSFGLGGKTLLYSTEFTVFILRVDMTCFRARSGNDKTNSRLREELILTSFERENLITFHPMRKLIFDNSHSNEYEICFLGLLAHITLDT